MLMQLRMLKLRVGKGRQVIKQLYRRVLQYYARATVATKRAGYVLYRALVGVHEMHGRMHPNYYQITVLLVVDLCSSLAYLMMTQPIPIAGKLPIKTLVARQLPTNVHVAHLVNIGNQMNLYVGYI